MRRSLLLTFIAIVTSCYYSYAQVDTCYFKIGENVMRIKKERLIEVRRLNRDTLLNAKPDDNSWQAVVMSSNGLYEVPIDEVITRQTKVYESNGLKWLNIITDSITSLPFDRLKVMPDTLFMYKPHIELPPDTITQIDTGTLEEVVTVTQNDTIPIEYTFDNVSKEQLVSLLRKCFGLSTCTQLKSFQILMYGIGESSLIPFNFNFPHEKGIKNVIQQINQLGTIDIVVREIRYRQSLSPQQIFFPGILIKLEK